MVGGPHPQSVIVDRAGRQVQLKVHQCVWSGEYVPNSLGAILDCYRAPVARAEIDVANARVLHPVKDRITFGGGADWNLRRLHQVDPSLPMGFTIPSELDQAPAAERRERLDALLHLVPCARDIHVRLVAVEKMIDD